jgi:hypothetical protein
MIMTTKKKKKNKMPARPVNPFREQTSTHYAKARVAVRKYLALYGLDVAFLDSLTKKQEKFLFAISINSPRVRPAPGYRVPRQLIRYLGFHVSDYLRETYFKDESVGLTLEDAFYYGLGFVIRTHIALDAPRISVLFSPGQRAQIREMSAFFTEQNVIGDLSIIRPIIQHAAVMISKVNIRVYGYTCNMPGDLVNGIFSPTISISSQEPTAIRFTHQGIERTAYLVHSGLNDGESPYVARVPRVMINPDDPDKEGLYDIYIQAHAIQRIKERMDVLPAPQRNFFSMISLLHLGVLKCLTENRSMIQCVCGPPDDAQVILGYFPYIIDGSRLIVRTFLTPSLLDTGDGDIIHRRLALRKEDTKFLGMDKLGFFARVDFTRIPILQKAFEGTNIPKLIQFFEPDRHDRGFDIDEKKTASVQKFFEQKAAFDKERDL